jgi:hypothetical protein
MEFFAFILVFVALFGVCLAVTGYWAGKYARRYWCDQEYIRDTESENGDHE